MNLKNAPIVNPATRQGRRIKPTGAWQRVVGCKPAAHCLFGCFAPLLSLMRLPWATRNKNYSLSKTS